MSRSVSIESRGSRIVPPLERRDSVAKMAWDGLSSIVHRLGELFYASSHLELLRMSKTCSNCSILTY